MRIPILTLLFTCIVSSIFAQNKSLVPYENPESLAKGRVAVSTGTTHDNFITKTYPGADVVRVDNLPDVAVMVETGRVDFGLIDLSLAQSIIPTKPNLQIVNPCIFTDATGVGFRKSDHALHAQFNAYLKEIRQNGKYDKMVERWLNTTKPVAAQLEMPQKGKRLVVGTNSGAFPFTYISNGKMVGFDMELMIGFAEKEQYAIEFLDINFGGLISALASGKVDAVAACMCITEERKKQVLFSDSYYECPSAVITCKPGDYTGTFIMPEVVASDPERGATLEDTIRTVVGQQKVAVVEGTTQELYVSGLFPAEQVSMEREHPDAFLKVQSGNAGFTLCNIGVASAYMKRDSTLEVCVSQINPFPCCFGVNKNNGSLLEELNVFIAAAKESGQLDEIHKRWFETLDEGTIPDLPFAPDGQELCVGSGCTTVPFTFIGNGKHQGLDIEILSRFASATGRRIKIVQLPFGALVAALITGKVDIIANTLGPTEERKKAIYFTKSYDWNFSVLLGIRQSMPSQSNRLNWLETIKESFYNNLILENRYLLVLSGLKDTLLLSIFSLLLGTIIGVMVCYMRMRKSVICQGIAKVYVDLMRGVPVLVLLMINFYVIFASSSLSATFVAIISFAMNFGAYVSEMFRSSITSIDKGQYEAGIAMGFSPLKTFIYIVAPQAIARVMPIYKGEAISLIKMTSIVGYIAVQDLTKVSDIIRSRTFDAFFPLILVAIIYFLLSWLFSKSLDLLTSRIIRK